MTTKKVQPSLGRGKATHDGAAVELTAPARAQAAKEPARKGFGGFFGGRRGASFIRRGLRLRRG